MLKKLKKTLKLLRESLKRTGKQQKLKQKRLLCSREEPDWLPKRLVTSNLRLRRKKNWLNLKMKSRQLKQLQLKLKRSSRLQRKRERRLRKKKRHLKPNEH